MGSTYKRRAVDLQSGVLGSVVNSTCNKLGGFGKVTSPGPKHLQNESETWSLLQPFQLQHAIVSTQIPQDSVAYV